MDELQKVKKEIERRLEKLNPKVGMFGDKPLRNINPKTFPRESELEKLLWFINKLEEETEKKHSGKKLHTVMAEVTTPASSSFIQIRYKLPKDTKLKYGDKVEISYYE